MTKADGRALNVSLWVRNDVDYVRVSGQILQSQMEKLRMLSWGQLTDPTNGPVNGPFTPDITSSTSGMILSISRENNSTRALHASREGWSAHPACRRARIGCRPLARGASRRSHARRRPA